MKIKQDWHIHSEHSCDDACLKMEDLVTEAGSLGIENYGVSDHLHTYYNLPDIENSRMNYDAIIAGNPGLKEKFRFGLEISCVSEWELNRILKGDYTGKPVYGIRRGGPSNTRPAIAIDDEYVKKMGFDYVIGGVHWPLYCELNEDAVIKDYHRQCMFLITHKNIDILAHYLWWNKGAYDNLENPFLDFGNVPVSMKNELFSALKENGCAFEINLAAMLLSPVCTKKFLQDYLEYAVEIQSGGVQLSIGSDCHLQHLTNIDFEKCSLMIEAAGIDLNRNMFNVDQKKGKNT